MCKQEKVGKVEEEGKPFPFSGSHESIYFEIVWTENQDLQEEELVCVGELEGYILGDIWAQFFRCMCVL